MHDLPEVLVASVQVYQRAIIKGKVYYSMEYKRVKKRNSYTVAFKDSSRPSSICFGLIQRFIATSSSQLAVIQQLIVSDVNLPFEISGALVTSETLDLLLNSYITYKESCLIYVLLDSILEKCFNLSNSNWKVLTVLVNKVEIE